MSLSVNEQMLDIVKRVKEEAEKADKTFDKRSRDIQRKSGNNIDLYSGTATNRVAEIARDSKQACDDFYTTYQTLVVLLDTQCRPLLELNPDVASVNEVQKTIVWLNEESEIENNFAASLNNHNLGNIVTVNYYVSLENKMIQKFWEQTFRSMPGADQIIKKEEKEKAEAKERRRKAERIVRQQMMEGGGTTLPSSDESATDNVKLNKSISDALEKVNNDIKALQRQISDEDKNYVNDINEVYDETSKIADDIVALRERRNTLGFFKGKDKKAIDAQIMQLEEEQEKLKDKSDDIVRRHKLRRERLLENNKDYSAKRRMISPRVGNTIEFGTDPLSYYYRPVSKISWIVVKVTDKQLYLLSKDVLDCCKLDDGYDSYEDNTMSYLSWLKQFEESAFNSTEKKALVKSPLEEYKYAYLYTKADIKTLPESYLEASVTNALKKSTANIKGFREVDKESRLKNLNSSYWLHSPDSFDGTIHRVITNNDGKRVPSTNTRVTNSGFKSGIRPAIIVNRKTLVEKCL